MKRIIMIVLWKMPNGHHHHSKKVVRSRIQKNPYSPSESNSQNSLQNSLQNSSQNSLQNSSQNSLDAEKLRCHGKAAEKLWKS